MLPFRNGLSIVMVPVSLHRILERKCRIESLKTIFAQGPKVTGKKEHKCEGKTKLSGGGFRNRIQGSQLLLLAPPNFGRQKSYRIEFGISRKGGEKLFSFGWDRIATKNSMIRRKRSQKREIQVLLLVRSLIVKRTDWMKNRSLNVEK